MPGEAPAYNQAKCGRDHEKYPELKNAITDLLLKGDGKSCTPKTLRTLHKDLCDIFNPTSLNNQVGRTKKAIQNELKQRDSHLSGGDIRTKQLFGPGSAPYQEQVTNEISNLQEPAKPPNISSFNSPANMNNRVSTSVKSPRYDVTEDDQKMDIMIELPGVREKDVSLDLQDGGKGLKLRAIRYSTHPHGGGQKVQHSEFEQLFPIDPELFYIDTISATLRDGILVVSATKVPKKAEPKGRRIPIR